MKSESTYSFGAESPMKFQIPDKLAENYNAAAGEFFQAQRRFLQKFGREWNPTTEPISLNWTKDQKKAWAEFAKIFDKVNAENGPFHINDIMDDFLVRNAVQTVAAVTNRFGRVIAAAALGGALYGVLRRR